MGVFYKNINIYEQRIDLMFILALNLKTSIMITLISYLTKPNLPEDKWQVKIYKHLFHIAVAEGLVYVLFLIAIILTK